MKVVLLAALVKVVPVKVVLVKVVLLAALVKVVTTGFLGAMMMGPTGAHKTKTATVTLGTPDTRPAKMAIFGTKMMIGNRLHSKEGPSLGLELLTTTK